MKLTDPFTISPDAVAREVGGETLLLDLASGTYFGLDPIGGRIWKALEEGTGLEAACAAILEDFDVTQEVLERDVLALLDQLARQKLITLG